MKITAVIPARYGSSRLEGKPILDICGKPMIQHVYERVQLVESVDDVVVATDDERIVSSVKKFGGIVRMTSKDHKSGTDRVAEVMSNETSDIVVNVQGDEPLIDPRMVDEAIKPLIASESLVASTLCAKISNRAKMQNPNVVKVVKDLQDNALYFSRSLIPYPRYDKGFIVYEHIGIYVYKYDFLMKFVELPRTPLEAVESLEQLRILENGYQIKVIESEYPYNALSVDTYEDLEEVRRILKGNLN